MERIFVSYKRANYTQVMSLVKLIEMELHENCWVDLDGIESSVQFASKICYAIDNAEVVLFMHSSIHLTIDFENDWTIKELNYAHTNGKKVVLIKLDDAPLQNIFLLEYGSKNNINVSDSIQVQKLINDLRLWLSDKSSSRKNDSTSASTTLLKPATFIGKNESGKMPTVKLAASTNVGLFFPSNKDYLLVCSDLTKPEWYFPSNDELVNLGPFGAILVVADGENNSGEVASAIVVETIQQKFIPENLKWIVNDEQAIQLFLTEAVKTADLEIYQQSLSERSSQGMTASVVMAWIIGYKVYVCWCGNCRCYSFLHNTNELFQLTKDHSYVQDLIDKGKISSEDVLNHPLSNVLTNCLGALEKRAQPEICRFEIKDGDSIMLCSDGLFKTINDYHIAHYLIMNDGDPDKCVTSLISDALANGGHDNVSVAILKVMENRE